MGVERGRSLSVYRAVFQPSGLVSGGFKEVVSKSDTLVFWHDVAACVTVVSLSWSQRFLK